MSKIDNFAYPTPIPAKIWGCSLWSRSVMLGSAERKMVRLISREISFAEFEPIWSRYLNVTDRRTTCHGNTALRVASRGNKEETVYIIFFLNLTGLGKDLLLDSIPTVCYVAVSGLIQVNTVVLLQNLCHAWPWHLSTASIAQRNENYGRRPKPYVHIIKTYTTV